MKQDHCVFEEKIAEASRSGEWSDALLAHVADCPACEEVVLVASYLCESSSAARFGAELPDAGRIWWKAQATAKAAAIERALRPIVWARRFAFGACVAVTLAVIAMGWPSIAGFFANFAESLTHRNAHASAGHDSFLFLVTAVFLLILIPLIFGLYSVWSED
ncbi:MAG: hypothetical protein WA876_00140 [Candidatus Acidiferrales bacterium]